jgi:ankyrin repeat protein
MYPNKVKQALMILEMYQITRGKAEIKSYSMENDRLDIVIRGAACSAFLFPEYVHCKSLKPSSNHKIFKAIRKKDNAAFDRLLHGMRDLSIRDKFHTTPLWESILTHNYYALKKLLEAGANMYELDPFELGTPVYKTALSNDVKALKILLEHGADVDSKNIFGDTALMTAMFKCNNFEAIRMLLEYGADINYKNKRGQTVLDLKPSFCKDRKDIRKMKALIERYGD